MCLAAFWEKPHRIQRDALKQTADTPRTNLHDDYYRQITVACHILNVSAFIQVECFTASRAFSDLPIRHTASKPADSLCASILSSKSMLPGICKIHWNLKYYTQKIIQTIGFLGQQQSRAFHIASAEELVRDNGLAARYV